MSDICNELENLKLTKPIINIVFIGHVDAGKSTICGQILTSLDLVDQRTLAKFKEESKINNRESWFLSYILDTNPEERLKGKTTETGRSSFELSNKKIIILDAPGHKNFISQMILGASQADLAILVLSARINEFEAGLKGQTKEHILLAKSMGIERICVLVNKMDDSSVNFAESRFEDIKNKITLFLRRIYKSGDIHFIPISGYLGDNIKDKSTNMPWYKGKTFLDFLNNYKLSEDNVINCENQSSEKNVSLTNKELTTETHDSSFMSAKNENKEVSSNIQSNDNISKSKDSKQFAFLIIEKIKNLGSTYFFGKLTTGILHKNSDVLILPQMYKTSIVQILDDEDCELDYCIKNDNVKLKLRDNSEETSLNSVICNSDNKNYKISNTFTCMITIINVNNIISAGYKAVLHLRNIQTNCEILSLRAKINDKMVSKKFVKKGESCLAKIRIDQNVAFFEDLEGLSVESFAIREKDLTIALGKIRKILDKS